MKICLLICCLLPLPLFSQLVVADIFSSDMLLQRDQPVPVWGKGEPGSKVEVHFGAITRHTTVTKNKEWIIWLPAMKASFEPRSLSITNGDTTIRFYNILTGDLWLCLGQSNMEWPMRREQHYEEAIRNCNQPSLRFYNPAYAGKNTYNTPFTDSICRLLNTTLFWKGHWQVCDSNTIVNMSAVAYYFGRSVSTAVNIPIGLINLSIGGAPLETFIDLQELKKSPAFRSKATGDWLQNNALPVWVRERGMQNTGSITHIAADTNGKNHAFKPGFAYAAGIKKILPLPIKGILLYQGESNAQEIERVQEYGALSELMIKDYRVKWANPELPFYYVQLSSIDSIHYKSQLWPMFRDEQRKLLHRIPNSGMAVCSDIGAKNDVHPTNKKEVGERLSRWALNKTYGKELLPSGPVPLQATYENGKIIIRFDYCENGLLTADGIALRGFSIDGRQDCPAFIEKNKVIIPVPNRPSFVYYGWAPFTNANLINTERLPATTFKLIVQ